MWYEDIDEKIEKYGSRTSCYMPFDNAVAWNLQSNSFIRTGFLTICPSLSARDYKDPKVVVRMRKVCKRE